MKQENESAIEPIARAQCSDAEGLVPAVMTAGMTLPNGAIVEQIAAGRLILLAAGQRKVSRAVEYSGARYLPLRLGPDYERALRMPDGTADYGTLMDLQQKVASCIERACKTDPARSTLLARFVMASWVCDVLARPPVLNVAGPPGAMVPLCELLRSLCRRPIPLIDVTPAQLAHLPKGLGPTIFVTEPGDKALRLLLAICDGPDMLLGDNFLNIRSSVVVVRTRPLAMPALRLVLPEVGTAYRRPSPQQIEELRDLRRQLLAYRLKNHQAIAASTFDLPAFGPEARAVAQILGAALEGCEDAQAKLIDALAPYDENVKCASACRVEAVVLEALLALVHEQRRDAYMGEIAKLANAILYARQNPTELRGQDVGAVLRDRFGFSTARCGKGERIRFMRFTVDRIHAQAHAHGVLSLLTPLPRCEFCQGLSQAEKAPHSEEIWDSSAPPTPSAPTTPSTPTQLSEQEKNND